MKTQIVSATMEMFNLTLTYEPRTYIVLTGETEEYRGTFKGSPQDRKGFQGRLIETLSESESPIGLLMNSAKWDVDVFRTRTPEEQEGDAEIKGEAEMNRY